MTLRFVGPPLAAALLSLACPSAPRTSGAESPRPRPTHRPEVQRAIDTAARAAAKDAPHPLIDKDAPALRVEALDGKTISLQSLRGKVVVVDLWATWCEPCVRAMPEVQALAEAHREAGVAVLLVNQGEDMETARAFVAQKKLGPPLLLGVDPEEKASEALQADGLPHTMVIDHAGVVRAVHSGYSSRTSEELRREVDQALARRARDAGVKNVEKELGKKPR